MKLSSKPILSPSRTEKYPPPLMRFLRTNVGNKSRGRSKSSPMFVRKKIGTTTATSNSTTTDQTQEPSSPKVTCIGQVRVRRSKHNNNGNKSRSSTSGSGKVVHTRKRCKWVANALFCRNFHHHGKNGRCNNFKLLKPVLSKWVLFFRFGCREKSKLDENCDEKVENFDRHYFAERRFSTTEEHDQQEHEDDEIDDDCNGEDGEDEDDDEKLISCSTTPPKNAFLLTRCRSAPYRSSSLATRFWGSPQITSEDETKSPKIEIIHPILENEEICRDSSSVAEPSSEDQESEENAKICNRNELELEKTGEEIEEVCSSVSVIGSIRPPLLLTRCKSEPASRAADKIHPELIFSRK